MADGQDDLRLLYMHGLESGPGGSKDTYLRRHFQVCMPDMKISLYRLSKSNSVLRNAVRQPLFLQIVRSIINEGVR